MVYRFPTPSEALHGDAELPAVVTITDFWHWAMTDLCEDYIKGFFAEWLVGALLKLPLAPQERRLWSANCDLRHKGGTRIEVKATSYWQSWRVFDEQGEPRAQPIAIPSESKIQFRVAPTRTTTAGSNRASAPGYKADLYVFCFEHEQELEKWNALDLTQWEFYYLQRDQLEQLGTKTVSLSRLRRLFADRFQAPRGLTARRFQEEVGKLLDHAV